MPADGPDGHGLVGGAVSLRLSRIAEQWASWRNLQRGDVSWLIGVAERAREWQRRRDACDDMERQGRVCGSEYVDAGNDLIAAELALRGALASTDVVEP